MAASSADRFAASIHLFASAWKSSTDMPVSVATRIFSRSFIDSLAIASWSPDRTVLNGSTFLSFGFFRHDRRHAFKAIDHLGVHWVLDPQRAVLVEGGDALLRRHEFSARLVGRRLDEFEDGLLRRSVIP